MKRYLLFSWGLHEASGGMNDFVDSYDTLEDLIQEAKYIVDKYTIVSGYDSKEWKEVNFDELNNI